MVALRPEVCADSAAAAFLISLFKRVVAVIVVGAAKGSVNQEAIRPSLRPLPAGKMGCCSVIIFTLDSLVSTYL